MCGLGPARILFRNQTISFPRLFYGRSLDCAYAGGLCLSTAADRSQLAAGAGSTLHRCKARPLWNRSFEHRGARVMPSIPANCGRELNNVQR